MAQFRNRSVNAHQFAMIPRATVPRSAFKIQTAHKTTFDAGYLIPVYVDEVLPGDTFRLNMTAFARLSTPLFPVMDNMYLESFFFFVPNRLVWENFPKFMGEQENPDDSIDYLVPIMTSPVGGHAILSIYDYMGLPCVGQVDPAGQYEHSLLPLRAYNLIYNEWFRDQNLQDAVLSNKGDGPENAPGNYNLLRRGKRHDYFTSCLPWPQKGDPVVLPLGSQAPLGGTAPVLGIGKQTQNFSTPGLSWYESDGTSTTYPNAAPIDDTTPDRIFAVQGTGATGGYPNIRADLSGAYADLSQATAATINQIRQALQIQLLLERDARGGTRYVEKVRAHFGVISPDARLQRPEYLGGGSTPVAINPIAQTSGSGAYTDTPQGSLAGIGQVVARNHGFTQSFTEHGVLIGLVSVRADLTYQQGLRRMWSRRTQYDFYWPAFAELGEQAVLNKEIYCQGLPVDDEVFGYNERWGEYRYNPSMITGLFRSTSVGTIDPWHLAQHFTTLPTLNATFIEDAPPIERVVAVGPAANGQQFIFDSFFDMTVVRPMPMFSVPGLGFNL